MKERPKDLSFYEWRFAMWRTSSTRDMLHAAGRGIYRELLDQCYAQGEFPDDAGYICRVCACSKEEFDVTWKVIEKHFPKTKNGARHNKKADLIRRQYAAYVQSQRDKREKGIRKSRDANNIDNSGQTTVEKKINLTRTRTRTLQEQEQGHEQGTAVEPRSVVIDESQPGFWAERWYERHPKKRDLVLVFGCVEKLFQSGGIQLMRLIDDAHREKCLSEDWLKDGGRFASTLPRWLEDRGWTAPIPVDRNPMDGSKFSAAFKFFEEREKA